jgi:hypothetical protein
LSVGLVLDAGYTVTLRCYIATAVSTWDSIDLRVYVQSTVPLNTCRDLRLLVVLDNHSREHGLQLSSKLIEMDWSSLLIEIEEGLGRRSAVAEAILWEEQETEIVMFMISCLLLANYKSLQLYW